MEIHKKKGMEREVKFCANVFAQKTSYYPDNDGANTTGISHIQYVKKNKLKKS